VRRSRLVRESCFVEGAEEPVAAAVAGEHAASAVGTVGGGRKAEDYEARFRIAEARHGPAPVFVFTVGSAPLHCDSLAMLAEARAKRAFHDAFLDPFEGHTPNLGPPLRIGKGYTLGSLLA
jgi:hypothetical protein